jgi:hypothetical protein
VNTNNATDPIIERKYPRLTVGVIGTPLNGTKGIINIMNRKIPETKLIIAIKAELNEKAANSIIELKNNIK